MSFIADLHVHSRFSRATSRECTLEGLYRWAQLKGVRVVGTGDFTHPEWLAEIERKLEPGAPGLYRLRPEWAAPVDADLPARCRAPVDFMLTAEISSIYKRDGRVRKVHTLVFVPDLDAVRAIDRALDARGNIRSDGRPILGLDPREIARIAFDVHPEACIVPAHIWTPWFSMLGSKSGFDTLEECFGELASEIFAVETGLSSDPPMNWRVAFLDRLALISNSDLHSPANLARNANLFHCAPDYFAMRAALRSKDPAAFGGTLDLFPEEGKYHLDGHRKCGVCLEPEESRAHGGLCPACGKPLVLGVLHRVVELADRPKGARPAGALPCEHIIPLPELLAELYECGAATKKVRRSYFRLLHALGPELDILRTRPLAEIEAADSPLLAEAIRRVRAGQVIRKPGFDGEYGEIRVFAPGEKARLRREVVLIQAANMPPPASAAPPAAKTPSPNRNEQTIREPPAVYDLAPLRFDFQAPAPESPGEPETRPGPLQPLLFEPQPSPFLAGLTAEQRRAVTFDDRPLLIVAGPGAGKTAVLTRRIGWLIRERRTAPDRVLAVTFTNRAAREMRARIQAMLSEAEARAVTVDTFHGFCLGVLRRDPEAAGLPPHFQVIDSEEAAELLAETRGWPRAQAREAYEAYARAQRTAAPGEAPAPVAEVSPEPPHPRISSPGFPVPPVSWFFSNPP